MITAITEGAEHSKRKNEEGGEYRYWSNTRGTKFIPCNKEDVSSYNVVYTYTCMYINFTFGHC